MAKLECIVLHCSDSKWGSIAEIRRWHLANGWQDAGYHFGIANGWIRPDLYMPDMDGSLEVGRFWDGKQIISGNSVGAHTLGYNDKSLGVVLIGVDEFTPNQFWKAKDTIETLLLHNKLNVSNVFGHYEKQKGRTCPNIDMDWFRDVLFKDKIIHHPESYPFEIDKYWMKLR